MSDTLTAMGAIGLWGRIHVADCPYCHGKHHRDDVELGETVMSGCGQGYYTLDCWRINLNCAAPSASGELHNE